MDPPPRRNLFRRQIPFITTVKTSVTSKTHTVVKSLFPPIHLRSRRGSSPKPIERSPSNTGTKGTKEGGVPAWDPSNPNRKQLPRISTAQERERATRAAPTREESRKDRRIQRSRRKRRPSINEIRKEVATIAMGATGVEPLPLREEEQVQELPPIQTKPEGIPEEQPSNLGLGVTMWLHKFLYNTRQKSAEKKLQRDRVEVLKKADSISDLEIVSNAKKSMPQPRRQSWGDLRRSIINAKISDALETKKFHVNGVRYTSFRVLGEGGFSKVYEVYDKSRETFALKVVDLTIVTECVKPDLIREIEFLKRFQGSSHVIQLLADERVMDGDGYDSLHMLMERGECPLSSILRSLTQDERLTPSKLRFYWEQMLEAMQCVHDMDIVHADIKPANFLLVKGQLKLIDFGFAVQVAPGEETVTREFVGGTKDYMSPESLSHYVIEDGAMDVEAMREQNIPIKVGFKSDIWALGVILYQLTYGGVAPFSYVPGGKLGKLKALISPEYPVDFEPIDDPLLLHTMQLCLTKDPKQRPHVSELLQHAFLSINMAGQIRGLTVETSSSIMVEVQV